MTLRVINSFKHPPSGSDVKSSMGCNWVSAAVWTFMSSSKTAFTSACRGVSALVHGAPYSPPFSVTLVSAELFLSYNLTPLSQLLPSVTYPKLSEEHYHLMGCWWAQFWTVTGSSWSLLELASSNTGIASGVFSQKPPEQPVLLPSFVMQIQYVLFS